MINIDEYANWTDTTAVYDPGIALEYLQAGLVEEVGELLGAHKKYLREDYDITTYLERVNGELGDIFWYLVRLCRFYGADPSTILQLNHDKLMDRKKRNMIRGDGDAR